MTTTRYITNKNGIELSGSELSASAARVSSSLQVGNDDVGVRTYVTPYIGGDYATISLTGSGSDLEISGHGISLQRVMVGEDTISLSIQDPSKNVGAAFYVNTVGDDAAGSSLSLSGKVSGSASNIAIKIGAYPTLGPYIDAVGGPLNIFGDTSISGALTMETSPTSSYIRVVPGPVQSSLELVADDRTTTFDVECASSHGELRIQANSGLQELLITVTSESLTPVEYRTRGDGVGHTFASVGVPTHIADFIGSVNVSGALTASSAAFTGSSNVSVGVNPDALTNQLYVTRQPSQNGDFRVTSYENDGAGFFLQGNSVGFYVDSRDSLSGTAIAPTGMTTFHTNDGLMFTDGFRSSGTVWIGSADGLSSGSLGNPDLLVKSFIKVTNPLNGVDENQQYIEMFVDSGSRGVEWYFLGDNTSGFYGYSTTQKCETVYGIDVLGDMGKIGVYSGSDFFKIDSTRGIELSVGPSYDVSVSGALALNRLFRLADYDNVSPTDGDVWRSGSELLYRDGATTVRILTGSYP